MSDGDSDSVQSIVCSNNNSDDANVHPCYSQQRFLVLEHILPGQIASLLLQVTLSVTRARDNDTGLGALDVDRRLIELNCGDLL